MIVKAQTSCMYYILKRLVVGEVVAKLKLNINTVTFGFAFINNS